MKGNNGMVIMVGAGPGDPGLITLKGWECLKHADVVVYDFLANPRLLEFAGNEAEIIYVGKQGGKHTASQEQINQILIDKAKKGKRVVRLKGGDPFIFGRGGEEAEALVRAGVAFEVVPGVTSAVAVPAYAGIPLTHRDYTSSVALITGHEDPTKDKSAIDWEKLAAGRGTLVFLMGVGQLGAIADRLTRAGRDPKSPVAVIRWGTTPDQETLVADLETVGARAREKGMKAPAIIVVGDVVKLRDGLNWFETKPLFGKRILVTRTRAQASMLSQLLLKQGAEPIEVPTIEIVPCPSYEELDAALKNLTEFDWLIFTSANGVNHFFKRMDAWGRDARGLSGCKVCAIGPATAQMLLEKGIKADLVPQDYRAEGIIAELEAKIAINSRVLIVRAEQARDILPDSLQELGAEVTVAPAYRTVQPELETAKIKKLFKEEGADVVTFTSSSTVTNLANILGRQDFPKLLKKVTVACIGPITAATAKELGVESQIVCQEYTIPALVDQLVEYFRLQAPGG
jgi:uroporphyrinogen III methyltransferase/synthase